MLNIILLNLRPQRCCLRIFLIGVSDHEKLSLKELFSPYIISSLHLDLREHIEKKLDVNIAQLVEEYQQDDPLACQPSAHFGSHQDVSDTDREVITINVTNFGLEEDVNTNADTDAVDADGDRDADGILDDIADAGCSGFGLDGSAPKWTKQKFWNYVDAMLEQVRENARHASNDHSGYEEAYRKYVICTQHHLIT
jgi:hypothetical protein